MKKHVVLVSLLSLTAALWALRPANEDWSRIFSQIDTEVSKNSRAYATLEEATRTIGHRLTGSKNGAQAEEYAYKLLKSYGFSDVTFQPFEVESWMRDTVTLSIAPRNSDNFRDVDVVALAHSPVRADVAATIVDVGNGLEEDFEAMKSGVKGKIVLANIGLVDAPGKKNLHRSEKTALAIKYGAVGIIMVNQAPGKILLTGTASVTGQLIPIPAVCISSDSGRELRAWLKDEAPLQAHIDMRNFSQKIKARNVIATLKGRTDETIVVGGHLDSWDLATGAVDNGIGSFAVLDIARTFRTLKIKPRRTIQFVMFMGEEQGLLGSRHMVKELVRTGQINKLRYVLNLDMTNNPNGVNAFGRDEMADFLKGMSTSIQKAKSDYPANYASRVGLHSDHQPFMLEGVPVLGLTGSLPPSVLQCYHADCDNFNLVDKAQLENTVRVASMYLYGLANAPSLPAQRQSSTQTRDFLIAQGLKQELVIGQDWRWDK